jgi:hypothetical protein
MSIQLRLDAPALAALFPEGSTARVDLQNAVMAQFINHYLKPNIVTAEVLKQVEAAKSVAVSEVMRALSIRNWSNVELTEDFKRQIRKTANDQVEQLIRTVAQDRAEEYALRAEVDLQRRVDSALERLTVAALHDRLAEKIKML